MRFRLGTFSRSGSAPFPGLVVRERVYELLRLQPLLQALQRGLTGADSLTTLLAEWPENLAALTAAADALGTAQAGAAGSAIERLDGEPIATLRVHAPIDPRQIFCAIGNYRSYIVDSVRKAEGRPRLGEPETAECLEAAAQAIAERLRGTPYFCLKLPSSVSGPADPLELPRHAERVDWELELAAIVGKRAYRVARGHAMDYLAGYTLVNDITIRDWVPRPELPRFGSDWLRAKNAPGFLPMGPYLVPAQFVPDPYALRLTLRLNGETMQDEFVSDLLFDIAAQIEYLSRHVQLSPGDIVCTGTPAGCGTRYQRFLRAGDVMQCSAPGFGEQLTTCVG